MRFIEMISGLKFLKTCSFRVTGTPIPWSTPDIGVSKGRRYARKNPALTEWQGIVNKAAREAYGPYESSTGPIYLELQFVLETDDEALYDCLVMPVMQWAENQARFKKLGGLPDRTNLIKGVED